MRGRFRPRFPRARLAFEAAFQRIHKVHDVARVRRRRCREWLCRALCTGEIDDGVLIAVLELARIEMPDLGVDDVRGKVEHVLRNALIFYVLEMAFVLADL